MVKKTRFYKNGVWQVIVQCGKGQMISEREVYEMNHCNVEGLLAVKVIEKRGKYQLVYSHTGLMPLNDFLLTPMNQKSFVALLQNVLNVLTQIRQAHFNMCALDMELEEVMVNPANRKLLFMYLPIQGYDAGCSLRTFLTQMIQVGSFVKEDGTDYVQEFIGILKDGINFSSFELDRYVENLISGKWNDKKEAVSCNRCGTKLKMGTRFCAACGARISDPMGTESEEKQYDPLQTNRKHLISVSDCRQRAFPYLVREKTGETIVIDKEVFRIGRSAEKSDYILAENMMIGRRHAIIFCDKGKYYIEDMQSINKTYVDEKPIEKEEIGSGTRIRLADEEFVFYMG